MSQPQTILMAVDGNRHGGPRAVPLLLRALAVSSVLLALLSPFAAPSVVAAQSLAPSPASVQGCAWPVAASITTSNVLGPDSNAAYWLEPFVVQSNLRIIVSGRFPDARYASFTVYDSATHAFTRNGVYSALADYQIAPEPGSVNPWQKQAPPGGHFTVTLRADIAPHEANTLPLAPAGTATGRHGYIVYRVYLPAGGDVAAKPLPTLAFQQGSVSRTLLACTHPSALQALIPASGTTPTATPRVGGRAAPTPSPTPRLAAAIKQLQFSRPNPQAAANIFPDGDDAPLVAILLPPGPADVVVVTAKAPRVPSGSHPVPWPAPGEDLRYWSLCVFVGTVELPLVANRLPNGTTDYGCRDNDATKVDTAGFYFYVIGRESQRAAIARLPHVTFLPFSATAPAAPHFLYLRNKLENPGFAHGAQQVMQYGSPTAAAAAMGPYYPQTAVCPLSTLTAKGPQACLPHP